MLPEPRDRAVYSCVLPAASPCCGPSQDCACEPALSLATRLDLRRQRFSASARESSPLFLPSRRTYFRNEKIANLERCTR